MHTRLLASLALATLTACEVTPIGTSDPADLEIVAGPNSSITALVNWTPIGQGSPGPLVFSWAQFLNHAPNPWQQTFTLPHGCGGDGFLLYRATTGTLYASTLWFDFTRNIAAGWCVGASRDMGLTWTWKTENQLEPDGARFNYSNDGLLFADGGPENPVHM